MFEKFERLSPEQPEFVTPSFSLLDQRSQSELDLQMIIDEKASVPGQGVVRDHAFPRKACTLGKVKHAIFANVALLDFVENFQEDLAPAMEKGRQ